MHKESLVQIMILCVCCWAAAASLGCQCASQQFYNDGTVVDGKTHAVSGHDLGMTSFTFWEIIALTYCTCHFHKQDWHASTIYISSQLQVTQGNQESFEISSYMKSDINSTVDCTAPAVPYMTL